MATIAEERQNSLRELETLSFVTSALFEISAEKIDTLRTAFDKNASFYTDISNLYLAVKQTALLRGEYVSAADAKDKAQNNRSLFVALTTNTRFYGSTNTDIMHAFMERIQKEDGDYMVIGKVGEAFLQSFKSEAKNMMFESFQDDEPTPEETKAFLERVAVYTHVFVLHSSFVNVFTQKVSVLDIAHAPTGVPTNEEDRVDYLFEPELPLILAFFETRVRHLLFLRVLLESELARTSSRLVSMNAAEDRANTAVVATRRLIRREGEAFRDARLLESFSAIAKWKK